MFSSLSSLYKWIATILVLIGLVSSSKILPQYLSNTKVSDTKYCTHIRCLTYQVFERSLQLQNSTAIPPLTDKSDSDPTKVKIDAMFNSADEFKGVYFFRFTENSVAKESPKFIAENWPDLPDDIDAVFSYRDGKIYFLKDTKYWGYSGFQLDDGFPKDINDTFNQTNKTLPTTTPPPTVKPDMCSDLKIDGMFNSADDQIFAFKGAYFFKFNENSVAKGYPKLISESWPDLPIDIDAVYSYRGDKNYFLKGTKYWQYSGLQLDDGYPKYINENLTPTTTPTPTATQPPTITPPPTTLSPAATVKPDICNDSKVDAMFNSADGQTYAFKGAYFFRFTDSAIAKGYPKLIAETWPDLPNDIDAAFSYKRGKSYFFKGSKFWRYSDLKLDDGYPKGISEYFAGIPDNLDAAMIWSTGVVFFKDSNYWYFDPMEIPHLQPKYPKPISEWHGVPNNLNAALEYANGGYTYFFKDDAFYRLNNAKLQIDDISPPYPHPTAKFWFDCDVSPPLSNDASPEPY